MVATAQRPRKAALKVLGAEQVVNIPVDNVVPSQFQARTHFDESKLKDMAKTIKAKGRLVHAIVVRPAPNKPDFYELVSGERRWRATKLAKFATVSAIVRNLTDEQAAEEGSIGNLQQEELSAPDEARGIKILLDLGCDLKTIAKRIGKSVPYLQVRLNLLDLPAEVQDMVSEEKINLSHTEVLHALPNAGEQKKAAKMAHTQSLTATQLKARTQHKQQEGRGRGRPSNASIQANYNHEHLSKDVLALHASLQNLQVDPQLPDQKRQTLAKQIEVLVKALTKVQTTLNKKPSSAV